MDNSPIIVSAGCNEKLQKTMTVKEVATALGTADSTIRNKVAELFPECVKNGVSTRLTERQVLILKESLVPRNLTLKSKVENTTTDLEILENYKRANADFIALLERKYKEEKQKRELAEKSLNRIADGKGCFSMNQAAKALKLPYGNITLYKKLRLAGVLNSDNSPKQEQTNNGNFKVVVKFINEQLGNKPVTLVTSKGLVYLSKKLNTDIDSTVKADC